MREIGSSLVLYCFISYLISLFSTLLLATLLSQSHRHRRPTGTPASRHWQSAYSVCFWSRDYARLTSWQLSI